MMDPLDQTFTDDFSDPMALRELREQVVNEEDDTPERGRSFAAEYKEKPGYELRGPRGKRRWTAVGDDPRPDQQAQRETPGATRALASLADMAGSLQFSPRMPKWASELGATELAGGRPVLYHGSPHAGISAFEHRSGTRGNALGGPMPITTRATFLASRGNAHLWGRNRADYADLPEHSLYRVRVDLDPKEILSLHRDKAEAIKMLKRANIDPFDYFGMRRYDLISKYERGPENLDAELDELWVLLDREKYASRMREAGFSGVMLRENGNFGTSIGVFDPERLTILGEERQASPVRPRGRPTRRETQTVQASLVSPLTLRVDDAEVRAKGIAGTTPAFYAKTRDGLYYVKYDPDEVTPPGEMLAAPHGDVPRPLTEVVAGDLARRLRLNVPESLVVDGHRDSVASRVIPDALSLGALYDAGEMTRENDFHYNVVPRTEYGMSLFQAGVGDLVDLDRFSYDAGGLHYLATLLGNRDNPLGSPFSGNYGNLLLSRDRLHMIDFGTSEYGPLGLNEKHAYNPSRYHWDDANDAAGELRISVDYLDSDVHGGMPRMHRETLRHFRGGFLDAHSKFMALDMNDVAQEINEGIESGHHYRDSLLVNPYFQETVGRIR